jgi:hypothetical protein
MRVPPHAKPIIDYGKESARRRRSSPFLAECLPTFGVLLAIPSLLACFVTIGATIEAGTHMFPLTYDRAAAFGRCAVALVVCILCTSVAFRWICEAE